MSVGTAPQVGAHQQIANMQKARAARSLKSAALRTKFADMSRGNKLAQVVGVDLPRMGTPVEPKRMERWLRTIGVPVSDYLQWSGELNLSEFASRNPDWPFKAWAGLVLEHFAEQITGQAIEGEEPKQRPLTETHCKKCGRYLASVLRGSKVLCPKCLVWSKPKPTAGLRLEAA